MRTWSSNLQALVTDSTLRQAESGRVHFPILPLIVEGARSALRPRGVSASCADVPGLCPALWDLPLLRSRARLLFARVPDGGAPRVRARRPPPPSTEC